MDCRSVWKWFENSPNNVFFKVVEQNYAISDKKYSKVSVGSEYMEIEKEKHYTKFETKMMRIVVKSETFTPAQTAKQVSQKPQWTMSLISNTFADPPE